MALQAVRPENESPVAYHLRPLKNIKREGRLRRLKAQKENKAMAAKSSRTFEAANIEQILGSFASASSGFQEGHEQQDEKKDGQRGCLRVLNGELISREELREAGRRD